MKPVFLLLAISFVTGVTASINSPDDFVAEEQGPLVPADIGVVNFEDADVAAKSYCWSKPDYACYEGGYPTCCFEDGQLPIYGGKNCPSTKQGCDPKESMYAPVASGRDRHFLRIRE